MMTLEDKILKARGLDGGRWKERICAEIAYAEAVSSANGREYDGLVERAVEPFCEKSVSCLRRGQKRHHRPATKRCQTAL